MTDVLLEPDVHHILWDEFPKSPQMIAAGEDCVRAAMPRIKTLLSRDPKQPEPLDAFSRSSR
jgi:hypothetical protein